VYLLSVSTHVSRSDSLIPTHSSLAYIHFALCTSLVNPTRAGAYEFVQLLVHRCLRSISLPVTYFRVVQQKHRGYSLLMGSKMKLPLWPRQTKRNSANAHPCTVFFSISSTSLDPCAAFSAHCTIRTEKHAGGEGVAQFPI